MKNFLILFFIIFSFNVFAWYPVHANNEFRIIASGDIHTMNEWKIQGQLISMKPVDDLKIGGIFSKSDDESSVGAKITYSINPFLDLTATGDLKSLDDLGATFIISGNFYHKDDLLFKPFLQVDHEQVGEVGFIVYANAHRNIWFHMGLGYSPKMPNSENYKIHKLSIILGTTFAEGNFRKKSKTVEKNL